MCMNSDGDWKETVNRTARLIAALCFDFGWTVESIMQHHDFPRSNGTKKDCPSKIRDSDEIPNWDGFVAIVAKCLSDVMDSEGFRSGYSISKEIASSDLEINDSSFLSEDDFDHGEIIIPHELLSLEE